MPIRNVQVLLDSCRERQKTGVVRLGYAGEKQLFFIYKRGEMLNAYLVSPEKTEVFQAEQANRWILSAGDAYTMSVSLSSFGLLIAKLLFGSRSQPSEALMSHARLLEFLQNAASRPQTALIHLAWNNAAGSVLFEENAEPHVIFISKDIVYDEPGSYKILSEWREVQCAVTLFYPDLETPVWQEYFLRSAFARLFQEQISRFETLTGRGMVDSLVRLVEVFALRQNLDISITARKLVDREVFSSPQHAAQTYREILAELFEHFSAVIGPRLHTGAVREIIKTLPEAERKILKMYSILPEGYLYE